MVPLGEVRWLNNRESAPQIDKTAGMPASELLWTRNRQITEVIPKYVVYSGEEMLEELVEYAKLRYGTTFSRGVDIFPVLVVGFDRQLSFKKMFPAGLFVHLQASAKISLELRTLYSVLPEADIIKCNNMI